MASVDIDRFTPAKNDGFIKAGIRSARVMVPAGARRHNLVIVNAKGATLRTTKKSVVQLINPSVQLVESMTVKYNRHTLPLMGVADGEAEIECSMGGTGLAGGLHSTVLRVNVLRKKEVNVAFHYVEDSTGRKTSRLVGSEDSFLRAANKIFAKQANITFRKKKAAKLIVAKDLGNPITYATLGRIAPA